MAPHRYILTGTAVLALAACEQFPDFDLRDLGNGFDTSAAVTNLPNRPAADDRGIISYPNYQVVVARQNETITTISERLGLNTVSVAAFNGIEPDVKLRPGELVALPGRVTEPSPATGAATTGPIVPLSIEEVATTSLDGLQDAPRVPEVVTPQTPPLADPGIEPIRHRVERGQTVFELSRLYNVPVRDIAEWNSLTPDLVVREGQFLLIPQGGAQAPTPQAQAPEVAVPTPAPVPAPQAPSVAPIAETPTPAPAPATSTAARLIYPVDGPILRPYAPDRNEGIDISATPGTPVRAADSGVVAAVTTDTSGVAIVVLRHEGGLLTVYTNMENLTVSKDDRVAQGDNLGQVRDSEPGFLHFEVRRGLQSLDPADFLP